MGQLAWHLKLSCPAKADFVSREAGFRVRRKRRRCGASQGHGMAADMLAWVGAVPGPQDRQWRSAATVAFVVARKRLSQ